MVFIVSQRKAHSTLHPRLLGLELHQFWMEFHCGVNLIAANYCKAYFTDINIAHI